MTHDEAVSRIRSLGGEIGEGNEEFPWGLYVAPEVDPNPILPLLRHCPEVVEVWLNDTVVSDLGLLALTDSKSITSLTISHCSRVTAKGTAVLPSLLRLRVLDFRGDHKDDEMMRHIGQCHGLRKLMLQGSHFTQEGLAFLSGCAKLEVLNVSETPAESGLCCVSAMSMLKRLTAEDALLPIRM